MAAPVYRIKQLLISAARRHHRRKRPARNGSARLIHPGFFAFFYELPCSFRRAHFPAMLQDKRIDVFAAHHTTPSHLVDFTTLLSNQQASAAMASILSNICRVRHHLSVSFPFVGKDEVSLFM